MNQEEKDEILLLYDMGCEKMLLLIFILWVIVGISIFLGEWIDKCIYLKYNFIDMVDEYVERLGFNGEVYRLKHLFLLILCFPQGLVIGLIYISLMIVIFTISIFVFGVQYVLTLIGSVKLFTIKKKK